MSAKHAEIASTSNFPMA